MIPSPFPTCTPPPVRPELRRNRQTDTRPALARLADTQQQTRLLAGKRPGRMEQTDTRVLVRTDKPLLGQVDSPQKVGSHPEPVDNQEQEHNLAWGQKRGPAGIHPHT